MNAPPEHAKAALLDECIDLALAGRRWDECLPVEATPERRELAALMNVAEGLQRLAKATPGPEAAQAVKARRRLEGTRRVVRQIAFYRLPLLPPLWIRPEAC